MTGQCALPVQPHPKLRHCCYRGGSTIADPNRPQDPLGVRAADTIPSLQTEAFKEIINKVAWAIGSSYRVPYRNPRTGARLLAITVASDLVSDQGYPRHVSRAHVLPAPER